jgi:hypothetical protein
MGGSVSAAVIDQAKGKVKVYLPDGRQSPRLADIAAAYAWLRRATA